MARSHILASVRCPHACQWLLDMPLSEVHHDLLNLKDEQAWDGAIVAGQVLGFRTAKRQHFSLLLLTECICD